MASIIGSGINGNLGPVGEIAAAALLWLLLLEVELMETCCIEEASQLP